MFSIYVIKNTINSKVYIGYTKRTLNARFRAHISCAKNNPKFRFHFALKKYKPENFYINLLEDNIETEELATLREKYWIRIFESDDSKKGYNGTSGGTGGWMIPRMSKEAQSEWLNKITNLATGEKNSRFSGISNEVFFELLSKKCFEIGYVMPYGSLAKFIREDDGISNFPKSCSKYRGSAKEVVKILIEKTGLPFKMCVKSDEHRKKIAKILKNRIWICNEHQRKCIDPKELNEYLTAGWIKGRKYVVKD
jgi:predicted GIY-YIG superfamily endonuclease